MKVSKLSWLFLIIGVVVIAALSLGMTHSSQSTEQKQLQSQLTDARNKIAALDNSALLAKQAQLNQDMAKYNAQIDSTRGKLTSDWDSISAVKAALDLASYHNLAVGSISSSQVGEEQLGGAPCQTLALDFQVYGDILNIRDFVIGLSETFPTALVKSDQVDNAPPSATAPAAAPTPSASPSATPSATPSPVIVTPPGTKATVHLVIYTYGGK